MGFPSVETVFSNVDLILEMFKRLDFQNQLRLSRVNELLAIVFKTYLWKEKYQTLNIFEKAYDFIVTNETDGNRLSLKLEELQEFLNVYAGDVERLNVKNIILNPEKYGLMAGITHGQIIVRNQLNISLFRNLKSLTYHYMVISLDHLKLVAELYPGLEELNLTNCLRGNDVNELFQEILPNMKKMKSLSVQDFMMFSLKYSQFQKIVGHGNLESLKVSAMLEPDETLRSIDENSPNPSNLKELHIQTTFEQHRWPNNFSEYLQNFENLTTLAVEIVETVTEKTLKTIAHACKELQHLNIRFTFFSKIKVFSVPPKLRELALNWCRGLTCENLQLMLTELPITKFVSKDTVYDGKFTRFFVSPLIESLHVDSIFTQDFLFTNNTNMLKDLTWYVPWSKKGVKKAISLHPCNNLQTFNINEGHLKLDTLLQLKSLQKLTMPHPVPQLTWSYIQKLLTHPSLKDLTIKNFCNYRYRYKQMNVNVPWKAVTTNVTNLQIPLDIFDVALTFWLDLFCCNENFRLLSCTFHPYEKYDEFLMKVVNHANFPRSVRHIDVCGFEIDCNRLRKDSVNYLEALHNKTYNTKSWHDDDVYRIIIEKKC